MDRQTIDSRKRKIVNRNKQRKKEKYEKTLLACYIKIEWYIESQK